MGIIRAKQDILLTSGIDWTGFKVMADSNIQDTNDDRPEQQALNRFIAAGGRNQAWGTEKLS